jgi:hypothetical protein
MRFALPGPDPEPRRPAPRTLSGRILHGVLLALCAAASSPAAGQTLDGALAARRQALPAQKTAYAETFLLAPAGGAASEKDLKLSAKVAVSQQAPKERIEIQPVSGDAYGDPVTIVGDGKDYFLITKVGTATPLAKSDKAQDPLVLQVLASMPNATGKKRVEKTPDGKLAAVVYRETRPADFDDKAAFSMKAPKIGGGILKPALSSLSPDDKPTVTASAGARGVDEIDTPDGKVPVTPDSSAVVWMEQRQVNPVALEEFLAAGGLGPYAGTEEVQ